MKKFIQSTAILAFVALSVSATIAHATKIIAQEEDAYELRLGEVSLPGSEAGTVIFKACDDCKTQSMRVSGTTIYRVNGRTVTLADFTKAAEDFRKRDGGISKTVVYVFYDIKSRRVNRMGMDYLG